MTHGIRSKLIGPLLERLGSKKEIKVIVDKDEKGIWGNAMDAWRSYDEDATHHMVLQDDILVCEDFVDAAEYLTGIISSIDQGGCLSFCDSLHRETRDARRLGLSWVKTNQVRHGQALVQPVSQIEDFINWAEWNVRPQYYHDDGRLEIYLTVHGKHIYHTVPSIVEHDDVGSVVNQVKGKSKKGAPYRAASFIGENEKALDKEWDAEFLYSFARMDTQKRWAIGIIPERTPDMTNRIFHLPGGHLHYDEVMAQARKGRGLI